MYLPANGHFATHFPWLSKKNPFLQKHPTSHLSKHLYNNPTELHFGWLHVEPQVVYSALGSAHAVGGGTTIGHFSIGIQTPFSRTKPALQ